MMALLASSVEEKQTKLERHERERHIPKASADALRGLHDGSTGDGTEGVEELSKLLVIKVLGDVADVDVHALGLLLLLLLLLLELLSEDLFTKRLFHMAGNEEGGGGIVDDVVLGMKREGDDVPRRPCC